MDGDMDGGCKASVRFTYNFITRTGTNISQMFWNWYTTDACFISSKWRISSASTFIGFCIGVISLVILLELFRRMQREFAKFTQLHPAFQNTTEDISPDYTSEIAHASPSGDQSIKDGHKTSCDINNSDSDATVSSSTPFLSNSFPFVPALLRDRRRHVRQGLKVAAHLIRAAIYTCEFALAYTIMLLAMYYNGYILICIFIGAFVGNFVWGWDLACGERSVDILKSKSDCETKD